MPNSTCRRQAKYGFRYKSSFGKVKKKNNKLLDLLCLCTKNILDGMVPRRHVGTCQKKFHRSARHTFHGGFAVLGDFFYDLVKCGRCLVEADGEQQRQIAFTAECIEVQLQKSAEPTSAPIDKLHLLPGPGRCSADHAVAIPQLGPIPIT